MKTEYKIFRVFIVFEQARLFLTEKNLYTLYGLDCTTHSKNNIFDWKKKYRMGKKKTPNKKGRKTKAALMREILYSGW